MANETRDTWANRFLDRGYRWILLTLLVAFGLQLLFFALTVGHYPPPDEISHFGISRAYAKVPFIPRNSPETYAYGLVTHVPYLYYWIMGRLLNLNATPLSDLLFLRLWNVALALATVLFALKLTRLLTENRFVHLLVAVMLTNTLMFSFLSAAVSYDNLTNFISVLSLYFLFLFFKKRKGESLIAFLCCLTAGIITKASYWPLAVILAAVLAGHEWKHISQLPRALIQFLYPPQWRRIALLLVLALGLSLDARLIGGNLLSYGSIRVSLAKVVSVENAMKHRIFARGYVVRLYKKGEISKNEALKMAGDIRHKGDREGAIYLIDSHDPSSTHEDRRSSLGRYIPLWCRRMLVTIFGILGHLSMPNTGMTLAPFVVVFLLAILALLLRWRPSQADMNGLLIIALLYVGVIFYYVNYRTFVDSGVPFFGLQGRYIFPVILPIYILCSFYLMNLFQSPARRLGVFAIVSIVFISLDFPFFLLHATPEWFTP